MNAKGLTTGKNDYKVTKTSINCNFSAIYFTRKRISHGSAKHLVENKVDVKQSKKEQYDTAKKKKKKYIYIYI